jgi:membrane protein
MPVLRALKSAIKDFIDDNCLSMAAALSFYTVFSLPGILVIVIRVAGYFYGEQEMQGELAGQIRGLIGTRASGQVDVMIQNANAGVSGGTLATVFGIGALAFAATTALAQLQQALNRAWEVQPDPESGGVRNFLMKRVLSFGMIVGVAFLLLVSLVVSAVLAIVANHVNTYFPAGVSGNLMRILNFFGSLLIVAFLFAAMYKVLPDAEIGWGDVAVGAIFTAVLFGGGKFLVSLYLGRSDVVSAFGAAGSLAIILLWTYYSSAIILLGAEFTQAWVQSQGREIMPQKGAVRVIEEIRRERPRAVEA